MKQDMILILDLGSEENVRTARATRDLGLYSEIYPHDISEQELKSLTNVKGIILNGGPNHIVAGQAIQAGEWIYQSGLPLLTIAHQTTLHPSDQLAWPEEEEGLHEILREFIFETCKAEANWNVKNFIEDQVELIRRQVEGKKVLLALSGGVDSSVVAALLLKAIGKQLFCVHVNHGLMRKGESEQVLEVFRDKMGANLIYVDASQRFLDRLKGVAEPEEKRRVIGTEFIRVFEEEARKLSGIEFLAQGTIYPDIVESGTKTAKVVKTHHNVGGLPADMQFALVEPVKFLFKDEVRSCGMELGLPASMVNRQPFPGPGLGVRCLGAITPERLQIVREADAILREEFESANLTSKVWQFFALSPDFKSTGIKSNARTFEYPVILRAINTIDAMTASVECLDWSLLQKITQRILAEVPGVNRVLYDLSPKPPATIEWE